MKQARDQRTGQTVLGKLKHLEPHQITLDEIRVTAKHWPVCGGQQGAVEEQVSRHR
jgi:hypothetical protein